MQPITPTVYNEINNYLFNCSENVSKCNILVIRTSTTLMDSIFRN